MPENAYIYTHKYGEILVNSANMYLYDLICYLSAFAFISGLQSTIKNESNKLKYLHL